MSKANNWRAIRFWLTRPDCIAPLDPEIIPLCDALNDLGFRTTSSCSGHGRHWPCVTFEHESQERVERMARFVLAGEDFDWYFSDWEKTIHLCGCYYSVTIHLQDQFVNTPKTKALGIAKKAIQKVADAVTLWDKMEKEWSQHQ